MNKSKSKAEVLVVHCIDTEGPIGGNVRRRPNGQAEFMDNWNDIRTSIKKLTSKKFRKQAADSFNQPYLYNWFIMDFTGFRTNPKQRIDQYNDTYDNFKKLPTTDDGFYWHYHHPPANGRGDQWSDDWNSSQEYLNILLNRLVERQDFPEAFRAGGTIEDNNGSHWLEDNIMVDYSNRVSSDSKRPRTIFDFNWFGAPEHWGYYHPHHRDFLKVGKMSRYIVRSVDLWSRLHVLTPNEVHEAFAQAKKNKGAVILSFFSHDHRDMFNETNYAISMIKQVSEESGIPWRASLALPALQQVAGLTPAPIKVRTAVDQNELDITFSGPIFQKKPFVGAQLVDGSLTWLPTIWSSRLVAQAKLPIGVKKVVIGGTSISGDKFVKTVEL